MSFIKLCVVGFVCIFLTACGNSGDAQSGKGSGQVAKDNLVNVYNIKPDEYLGNIKRTVEVRLVSKLSLEQLKAVAEIIKADEKKKTERTFIGYALEGHQAPGYWATTHYNPDLNVIILE